MEKSQLKLSWGKENIKKNEHNHKELWGTKYTRNIRNQSEKKEQRNSWKKNWKEVLIRTSKTVNKSQVQ